MYTKLLERISPSDAKIKQADIEYLKIVNILIEGNIVTGDGDIIKQGSYKTQTLTLDENRKIDLDILVNKHEANNAVDVKSVISKLLRSKGYKTESKTRALRATKNGFQIDILPVTSSEKHDHINKLFKMKEKGLQRQKTIDPIGYLDWLRKRKSTTFTGVGTPKLSAIDKEKYKKEAANSVINKAIRILKFLGYKFNDLDHDLHISSFEIECIVTNYSTFAYSLEEMVDNALKNILRFAEASKNFYNPAFTSELLIQFEGKLKYIKFVEFARKEINKLIPKPSNKGKLINFAGLSLLASVAPLATMSMGVTNKSGAAAATLASSAGHFGSNPSFPQIHRTNIRKRLSAWSIVRKLAIYGVEDKELEFIGNLTGTSYKFQQKIKENRVIYVPLFEVKDNKHLFPDSNDVCLSNKYIPNHESRIAKLISWIYAYEYYVLYGEWGWDEHRH